MRANSLTALALASLLFTSAASKGQSLFGNTPTGSSSFAIATLPGGYSTGYAVSFTPTVSFAFSSVTLCLSNYTVGFGLQLVEGSNPNTSTTYMNFGGASFASGNTSAPGEYTFTSTFSDGITSLNANQIYWLVAYSSNTATTPVDWLSGTTPTGYAVFNGTYAEEAGSVETGSTPSSIAPAFSFNAVPEPATLGLLAVGAAEFFMVRKRRSESR
jgi:hypothetical protein